jgi:hypothetical protein
VAAASAEWRFASAWISAGSEGLAPAERGDASWTAAAAFFSRSALVGSL